MVLSKQGRKQVLQDHRETLVFQRIVNYAQLGSSCIPRNGPPQSDCISSSLHASQIFDVCIPSMCIKYGACACVCSQTCSLPCCHLALSCRKTPNVLKLGMEVKDVCSFCGSPPFPFFVFEPFKFKMSLTLRLIERVCGA